MPTYPNLNRDFSSPGGVMDRPDLTVRTAALNRLVPNLTRDARSP